MLNLFILSSCGEPKTMEEKMETNVKKVEMEMTDGGKIVMELYPEIAPLTVANFLDLVNKKFYDGLFFHRVIAGFMIQTGDPKGDGTGGSESTIKGEFSENGVENSLLHTDGVVSMARSGDPNSASSQFFICTAVSSHLDGSYAAFGKVISGMETVRKIENLKTTDGDRPVNVNDARIKTIREIK